MTFPEIIKTTLWDIIDEISLSLSSFVKNPDKDFSRRRKLDFQKMMRLIISMESGSLNHELLKFFQYDDSVPTGSAFYQQRSKLSISAFRHLLKEFNLKFPFERFREKYFLIACDGSEFNIARNTCQYRKKPETEIAPALAFWAALSIYPSAPLCIKFLCETGSLIQAFFVQLILAQILQ